MNGWEQTRDRQVDSIASISGWEKSMFARFKAKFQRRKIGREDRKYLEARARRFLNRYLSAGDADKERYYNAVAAATAACQPPNVISYTENLRVAEVTAAAASAVVRRGRNSSENDNDAFVLDAYATVAVGYRRAAGAYVRDDEMQSLGTAAVHLLTMANSRRMAKSKDDSLDTNSGSAAATEPSCKSN